MKPFYIITMRNVWLTLPLILSTVAGGQDFGVLGAALDEVSRPETPPRPVPLLDRPAPPLPWADVFGVDGESAEQRVETLKQMTKGRVVLLDFWATWCGFCVQSMPHGLRLAQESTSPDSAMVIFATYIDPRNTTESVRAFVEHGYKARHGVEFDGIVATLDDVHAYQRWVKIGIPRYAVVDPAGIVRYEGLGVGAATAAVRAAEALVAAAPDTATRSSDVPAPEPRPVSIDERLTQAERALDEGRLDDAERQYRAILAEDPDHAPTYELLWQLCRGRSLKKTSKPYERSRRLLPDSFRESTTSHFIIFSDADSTWVRRQGEVLERAYDQFIRFGLAVGLRPLPIAHKLVVIAFESREDFNEHAGRDGVPRPGYVAGYYSRVEDRLVFYHAESSENVARGRDELETMLAEIDAIKRASRRARLIGRRDDAIEIAEGLDQRIDDFSNREQRVNILARQWTISVTVHESIHQLMFHTRVQAPGAHQPRWLSEGLATAFETDAPKSPFGPTHDYAPRRRAFWRLLDNDDLLPLRDLIVSRRTLSAEYDQSYALVSWMSRHRRPELRDYMRRLNSQPPAPFSAEADIAIFQEAFGDIEKLEERWLRFEMTTD